MHFTAAYTGCAIGEYYQRNHGHALVIYDSINNHAKSFYDMINDKAHLNYLYSRLLGKSSHLSTNKGEKVGKCFF
jgi:F0F1-type ATP synthase alpha subunit